MTPGTWTQKLDAWEHIREAVETELQPSNMNRDEGFSLSKSWKLLLQTMKEQNKALPV